MGFGFGFNRSRNRTNRRRDGRRDGGRRNDRGEKRELLSKENEAIILDFLQHGYAFDRKKTLSTPIAQGIGTNWFSILELIPKKDVFLQPYEKVYIGPDKRDKIHHVNGKIPLRKLTPTAKAELEHAIKEIVEEQEERFVKFFNNAPPLSTRMHSLELLPGVGKKHMTEILEKRKEEPFKDFEDLKKRVPSIGDPIKLIVGRVLEEIEGKDKHKLFTK